MKNTAKQPQYYTRDLEEITLEDFQKVLDFFEKNNNKIAIISNETYCVSTKQLNTEYEYLSKIEVVFVLNEKKYKMEYEVSSDDTYQNVKTLKIYLIDSKYLQEFLIIGYNYFYYGGDFKTKTRVTEFINLLTTGFKEKSVSFETFLKYAGIFEEGDL